MTNDGLLVRYHKVQARLAASGREVCLVAVSKRQLASAIEALYHAGHRDFGENYGQELRDKQRQLAHLSELRWHFIGPLQTNKVNVVVPCHLVHTVDRPSVAHAINKRAAREGATQHVLVQVNVAREPQKSGCAPEDLGALLDAVATCDHLHCDGLMVIPPHDDNQAAARPHFAALRTLAEQHAQTPRTNVQLRTLSMGMSHDLSIALEEGATMVRVGTDIFGPRPGPTQHVAGA